MPEQNQPPVPGQPENPGNAPVDAQTPAQNPGNNPVNTPLAQNSAASQKDVEFVNKTKDIVKGFDRDIQERLRAERFPFEKLDTLSPKAGEKFFDDAISKIDTEIKNLRHDPNLRVSPTNNALNGPGKQKENDLIKEQSELQAAKKKLGDHLKTKPGAPSTSQDSSTKKPEEKASQDLGSGTKSETDKINQLRGDIEQREKRAMDHENSIAEVLRQAIPHSTVHDMYYFILFMFTSKPSKELRDIVKDRFRLSQENLRELENLKKELEAAKTKNNPDDHLDAKDKKPDPNNETSLTPAGTNPDNTPGVELNPVNNNHGFEVKPQPNGQGIEFKINPDTPKVELKKVEMDNIQKQVNEIDPDQPVEQQVQQLMDQDILKIGPKHLAPPVNDVARAAGNLELAQQEREKQIEQDAQNNLLVGNKLHPQGPHH